MATRGRRTAGGWAWPVGSIAFVLAVALGALLIGLSHAGNRQPSDYLQVKIGSPTAHPVMAPGVAGTCATPHAGLAAGQSPGPDGHPDQPADMPPPEPDLRPERVRNAAPRATTTAIVDRAVDATGCRGPPV